MKTPYFLSLSSFCISGLLFAGHAAAQATFFPIAPDTALDGPSGMGSQRAQFLRASGTVLFGTIVDRSMSPFADGFGAGTWGLDGSLITNMASSTVFSFFEDQGEDGVSSISGRFSQYDDRSVCVFADGSSLFIDNQYYQAGGRFEALSADGMTAFGTETDVFGTPVAVFRHRPGQSPELIYDDPVLRMDPEAADLDGTTLVSRLSNGMLARWTAAAGVEQLVPIRLSTSGRSRMDVSYDGTVIVARDLNNAPVVWREGLGLQVLAGCPLAAQQDYYNLQLSPDGSRIDAWGTNSGLFFSWNQADGWRSMRDLAEAAGAQDLDNVDQNFRFDYRSRDGGTVLVNYSAPSGQLESQSLLFLGQPSPGALGSNYCGPAERNASGDRAVLQAMGSASVLSNSLSMMARFVPADACGYVISSTGSGLLQSPGSSVGNLCLGGGQTIGRHNAAGATCDTNGDGVLEFPIDLTALPGATMTMTYAAQPGQTLNFQVWFRDVDAAGAPTSNFTDAVSVTFE